MRLKSRLLAAMSLTLCLTVGTAFNNGGQVQAFNEGDAKKWDDELASGRTLRDAKKYAEAEKIFLDLQSKAEADGDKKRVRKAITALAANYFYRKDFAKAEELDRLALGMAEANSTAGDGTIALCLNDLAETLVEEGRFDEALPIIKKSVAISEQVFSHNHPLLGVRLNFLADLLERMGKKHEASSYRSEAQGIINSFMSVMSRKIKSAWRPPFCPYSYSNNVGFEVLDHGIVKGAHIIDSSGNKENDEAAIKAVQKAQPFLDIYSSADDDQLMLSFKFDYNYQKANGKPKHYDKNDDDDAISTEGNEASKDSAAVLTKQKEHLSETLKKIETLKKDPARKDTALAEAYGELTQTLKIMGEHQKAVKYLKDALATADFHSKKNPATLMMLCDLGSVYLTSMKPDLAETTLKEVVDSPNFAEIPDNKVKLQALDDMGHALSNLGHYAEAQKYYNRKHDLN